MIQRAVAASWKRSSAKYNGRSWCLAAVMLSNLSSVVLFGGRADAHPGGYRRVFLCHHVPGAVHLVYRRGLAVARLLRNRGVFRQPRAGVRNRPAERRLPPPLSHLRPLTREDTSWSAA